MNRKKQLLPYLKPEAIVANDSKYAKLLIDDGFYLRYGNRPQVAIVEYKGALTCQSQLKETRALLNEAYQRFSQ